MYVSFPDKILENTNKSIVKESRSVAIPHLEMGMEGRMDYKKPQENFGGGGGEGGVIEVSVIVVMVLWLNTYTHN